MKMSTKLTSCSFLQALNRKSCALVNFSAAPTSRIDRFRIEITSQPVELVEKTVTVQEPDDYAEASTEEYEDEYDEEGSATDAPFTFDLMSDQTQNMFQNYMHHLNESGFSMGELLSAVGEIFDRTPDIESSIPSHDRPPHIQPDIVDLFSHVVASLDSVTGTPPKKHRQKRQGPAGIFLIFLQILFFAVASSGFGGNFANIIRPNGQDQEVEQQTPNTNIPAPQTEYYTSTSTETETVYSTTATKTIFIQNCTPNPLPYGQCARRRDLQS